MRLFASFWKISCLHEFLRSVHQRFAVSDEYFYVETVSEIRNNAYTKSKANDIYMMRKL